MEAFGHAANMRSEWLAVTSVIGSNGAAPLFACEKKSRSKRGRKWTENWSKWHWIMGYFRPVIERVCVWHRKRTWICSAHGREIQSNSVNCTAVLDTMLCNKMIFGQMKSETTSKTVHAMTDFNRKERTVSVSAVHSYSASRVQIHSTHKTRTHIQWPCMGKRYEFAFFSVAT